MGAVAGWAAASEQPNKKVASNPVGPHGLAYSGRVDRWSVRRLLMRSAHSPNLRLPLVTLPAATCSLRRAGIVLSWTSQDLVGVADPKGEARVEQLTAPALPRFPWNCRAPSLPSPFPVAATEASSGTRSTAAGRPPASPATGRAPRSRYMTVPPLS